MATHRRKSCGKKRRRAKKRSRTVNVSRYAVGHIPSRAFRKRHGRKARRREMTLRDAIVRDLGGLEHIHFGGKKPPKRRRKRR
jgi:hypothetical protein